MQKIRKRRAIIIGGSLGGLLAAHQLRSIGWDVDVFERTADDLADRGAGIGTHPDLFEAMQRVGLTVDTSDCTQPRCYVCLDRDNRLVHEAPARRTMTAWSRLYRPLRDNLPPGSYHNGMLFERLEDDARRRHSDICRRLARHGGFAGRRRRLPIDRPRPGPA